MTIREAPMHFLYSVSKVAAAILRTILNTILAVIGAFCRLFGITPPGMPMPPQPTTTPGDVRDEYRNAFNAEAADDRYARDLGQTVYQYAAAEDSGVRCAVDLSGLSSTQVDWLLGLKNEDLQRLASAGPKACELAVCGKRSGIVGLSTPLASAPKIEGPHPVRSLLMERIRAAQAAHTKLVS
jgi:hypothetical protein